MTQPRAIGAQSQEERLTPDLLFLHARYPREAWPALPSGSLPSTWLSMHDSLRHGQEVLERLATHWQLKLVDTATFRTRALPLLRQHLGHLHGHHRLEDTHYFPQFRAMQPRLLKGFDLLANDHSELNASIDVLEGLTRDMASLSADDPTIAALSQRLAEALHRFGPALRQHLMDEEDLVIPLIAIADGSASAEDAA